MRAGVLGNTYSSLQSVVWWGIRLLVACCIVDVAVTKLWYGKGECVSTNARSMPRPMLQQSMLVACNICHLPLQCTPCIYTDIGLCSVSICMCMCRVFSLTSSSAACRSLLMDGTVEAGTYWSRGRSPASIAHICLGTPHTVRERLVSECEGQDWGT